MFSLIMEQLAARQPELVLTNIFVNVLEDRLPTES